MLWLHANDYWLVVVGQTCCQSSSVLSWHVAFKNRDAFRDHIFVIKFRFTIDDNAFIRRSLVVNQHSDIWILLGISDLACHLLCSNEDVTIVIFEKDGRGVDRPIGIHATQT